MAKGIYIGTFDPIHHGHVHMAVTLAEVSQLSEIWVIPALCSPFKQHAPPISIEHRLFMAREAFKPFPFIQVLDVEASRPAPSYTVDTLRTLHAIDPGPMRLLLGSEVARTLPQWKEPEEILRLAPPLVWSLREESPPRPWPEGAISTFCQRQVVDIPVWACSSSDIRSRLSRGLTCAHLLPETVRQYILEHRLYGAVPNPQCEVLPA